MEPSQLEASLPPHSRPAEEAVVGALLRDPDCLPDAADIVQADDFYLGHLRAVYAALVDLRIAGGSTDLVAVWDKLAANGERGRFGIESDLIAELYERQPTAANLVYHCGIVRDYAVRRRVIQAANEAIRDAGDLSIPAAEVAAESARKVSMAGDRFSSPSVRTLDEILRETLEDIDRRCTADTATTSHPTGFEELDYKTAGLHPGELVALGARPGAGKTAFAMTVAEAVARAGQPTLFVSLEMSGTELGQRLLVNKAGVSNSRVRRGRIAPDDADRLGSAFQLVSGLPFWVDDYPHQNVTRIAATARRVGRKVRIGLVVIDYLQLVKATDGRKPRHEQIAEQTRELKCLAKDLKCPVLLLVQLSRAVEQERRKPMLSDIRESGAVEQDSDTVMFLHAAAAEEGDGPRHVELIIAKQRNGPLGVVDLDYHGRSFRFASYTPRA